MLLLQRLEHNFHLLEISLLALAEERQELIFKLIDAVLTFDFSNVH
jgi:hypothetical protein